MELSEVSEQTLCDSAEGLQHWMEMWATVEPDREGVAELGAAEESREEAANKIEQVLRDREWFSRSEGCRTTRCWITLSEKT